MDRYRPARRGPRNAVSLIELLCVIAIILILTTMVLMTNPMGWVREKLGLPEKGEEQSALIIASTENRKG